MKQVFIHGTGAVSPAGWSVGKLTSALQAGIPLPSATLPRPGWTKPLTVRKVPVPLEKQSFLSHPRLRRASSITVYAAAAALEAMAGRTQGRLGIIFCVTGGCVQFSRRFYDETWRNPATASPVIFPETVFNAPSSHLAALLESAEVNYTFVGDPGTYIQALGTAADWLLDDLVDGCVVVAAEELDWITADAYRHFAHEVICSEGAGAVYLSCDSPEQNGVELVAITDSHLYLNGPLQTIHQMRASLPQPLPETLLCENISATTGRNSAEAKAWQDWNGPRLSPKRVLGEGLMASAAWQCVAAIDSIRQRRHPSAVVSVCSGHQQAIGAYFGQV